MRENDLRSVRDEIVEIGRVLSQSRERSLRLQDHLREALEELHDIVGETTDTVRPAASVAPFNK